MKVCIESIGDTAVCLACGVCPEKIHRPLFKRGSFCPACCPVCAVATLAPAAHAAAGTSAYVEAGRSSDPWYRDTRQDAPPPFIPQRRDWID